VRASPLLRPIEFFPAPGVLVYTEDAEQAPVRGTYAGLATFTEVLFTSTYNWSFSDPSETP
jgi:hypothetical protein